MKKTYQTKPATQYSYTSAHIINQCAYVLALFNAWQNLAAEATGRDTEWGYPIEIDRFAQVLQIPERALIVLLTKLTQPELELCSNNTAIAFHSPPCEDKPFANQELFRVYLPDPTLLEPFGANETQLIEANSIAA